MAYPVHAALHGCKEQRHINANKDHTSRQDPGRTALGKRSNPAWLPHSAACVLMAKDASMPLDRAPVNNTWW
jgi:hypothetical protein